MRGLSPFPGDGGNAIFGPVIRRRGQNRIPACATQAGRAQSNSNFKFVEAGRRIAELAPIPPPATPPMGVPAIIKPPIEEEEQEEQPPVNGEDHYRSQAGQS